MYSNGDCTKQSPNQPAGKCRTFKQYITLLCFVVNIAADKLSDVKIGEIAQWLARRNYHPLAMVRASSRGI